MSNNAAITVEIKFLTLKINIVVMVRNVESLLSVSFSNFGAGRGMWNVTEPGGKRWTG